MTTIRVSCVPENPSGITLKPRAVDGSGHTIHFADGTQTDADPIIWATGHESDYSWIELPILDDRGRARHRRGVTDQPGLYFLGLQWQYTRSSALLGFVREDADYIARRVVAGRRPNEPPKRPPVKQGRWRLDGAVNED